MANGLVNRYKDAGVSPPDLVYTDGDCCGARGIKALFPEWSDICVRLDIWHFMRRLAIGVTTEAHPLYATFMGRISNCIFEWSAEDFQKLKSAKARALGLDEDHPMILKSITKREMALHCRRKTRGAEKTSVLLFQLLHTFCGDQGIDTLGVPLLDADKTWEMWKSQEHHASCIVFSSMRRETTTSLLSKNKHAFKKYLNSFEEGKNARERVKKATSSSSQNKI